MSNEEQAVEMTFGNPSAGPDVDALVAKHFPSEPVAEAVEPAQESPVQADVPAVEPVAEEVAAEVVEEAVIETSSDFLKKVKEESDRRSNQDKLKDKLSGLTKYDGIEDLFKTDPLAAMEKLGFSTNDINNALANKHAGDDVEAPQEVEEVGEESELKKRLDAMDKANEDREFNNMVSELDGNVTKLVVDNDKYELIQQYGYQEEVTNFIIESGQHGQDLTYEKAADMIEAELEKQLFGNYDKMKSTNKYKNKYLSEQTPDVKIDKQPSEKAKPITNTAASQVGSEQTRTFAPDSPEFYADLVKRHGL